MLAKPEALAATSPSSQHHHHRSRPQDARLRVPRRKSSSSCSCTSSPVLLSRVTWVVGSKGSPSAAKSHIAQPRPRPSQKSLHPSSLDTTFIVVAGMVFPVGGVSGEEAPLTHGCAALARGNCEPRREVAPGPGPAPLLGGRACMASPTMQARKQASTLLSLPHSQILRYIFFWRQYCEIVMAVPEGSTSATRGAPREF